MVLVIIVVNMLTDCGDEKWEYTGPWQSWTRRIIIQQIVTLSKYGHDALDICHP